MTSSTATHLRQLLECTLKGTEVGIIYEIVGIDHSYHRYILKIKTFGYHLRSDKNVYAAVLKVVEQLYILVFLKRAVKVHSCHRGVGIHDLQILFYAFCPDTYHTQMGRVAGRAFLGHRNTIAAIVATQGVGRLVIYQRHIAMDTLGYMVTVVAFQMQRESSSVLEQDHLLFLGQRLVDSGK